MRPCSIHEGNIVADHFEGPSWQSPSGSLVVGTVTGKIIVDLTAIPWVRLVPVIKEGPGVFADVTFIQRVNTVGGKAPETDGAVIGQVAKVPYTADYFFYRAVERLIRQQHPGRAPAGQAGVQRSLCRSSRLQTTDRIVSLCP